MSNDDLGFVQRGLDKLLTRSDGLRELLNTLGELQQRVSVLEARPLLLAREPLPEVVALVRAARSIVSHWDEFGPEHGYGESIEHARAALKPFGGVP